MVFLFPFIFWINSHAYLGAASLGAGSPGYSSIDPVNSTITNPAGLAHIQGLNITFGNSNLQGSNGNSNQRESYLSLIENGPDSALASGLIYSQSQVSDQTMLKDIYLGVGNFGLPNMSVGLALHHNIVEDEISGNYFQNNLNIGLMYILSSSLGFGFSAENLIAQDNRVPEAYRLSSHWGAGLMYVVKEFLRVRIDISDRETGAGFESLFNKWSVFRMGFSKSAKSGPEALSLGLGFIGPRFHFNYGYRSYRFGSQDKIHGVDLIFPF